MRWPKPAGFATRAGAIALVVAVLFLGLAGALPLSVAAVPAQQGTTFTVNTTDDTNDGACNATHCSLREAIIAANAAVGTDTIAFNIPGSGPHTITPLPALPTITGSVIVDGYSQPGARKNSLVVGTDAVLKIELSGASAGTGAEASGLVIDGAASTVRGLVVNRFRAAGILLQGTGGHVVEGNYLGTDVAGTLAWWNAHSVYGVLVYQGGNNTIGGTTPDARNVISGHIGLAGVRILSPGNRVLGNYIGTDAAGAAAVPNIYGVVAQVSSTTIGGTTAGARNVISGNQQRGIEGNGDGLLIQGNYIGTNAAGTAAVGNGTGLAFGGAGSVLGGTTPGAGNVISGNGSTGLLIPYSGGVVQGNRIGTQADGSTPLGNGTHGIQVAGSGYEIGGTADGAGNIIAHNGGDGVVVNIGTGSTSTIGNAIRRNAIFANTGLGIDLNGDGVTANDAGDGDLGANTLQNLPFLSGTGSGSLNSTPNTTFRIEFFQNATCDPAGFGEGQQFLSAIAVTTDASGTATFAAPAGTRVTATATDPNGNTSEFSPCPATLTVPGATTLTSPSGAVTDATPTYVWDAVAGATDYELLVRGRTGWVVQATPTAASACSGGTCTVTPTTALAGGTYAWAVRAKNAAGFGPGSAPTYFWVGTVAPGRATLGGPSGPITDTTPTYTWGAVPHAAWYRLVVVNAGGTVVFDKWYPDLVICNATDCAATPPTPLAAGSYSWAVRTWNPAGFGLWSVPRTFTVPATARPSRSAAPAASSEPELDSAAGPPRDGPPPPIVPPEATPTSPATRAPTPTTGPAQVCSPQGKPESCVTPTPGARAPGPPPTPTPTRQT